MKIVKKHKYCLLAVDDVKKHCYFAFRGTQLDGSDLLNDIDIALTGNAHARIKDMDDFYDTEKVEYMKNGYLIFVTGHSLGGNVAENLLIYNDEICQCESFNAGNHIDIIPDLIHNMFKNQNEATLNEIIKGKSQEQVAKDLHISLNKVKQLIQKAKNSDENLQKDRQQRIISHRIAGDPISISKIYPYSQRVEVQSGKQLFQAHLMKNFVDLINKPLKLEEY